jgi:hypothetical protein
MYKIKLMREGNIHPYMFILHYPSFSFYLKRNVSSTGFCLLLQVDHTQFGLIDGAVICLRITLILSLGPNLVDYT